MKYVYSMEDLDQFKHALDISDIIIDPDFDRSKKKGKSKQKAKAKEKENISETINVKSSGEAQDFEVLTFSAGEFFIILFHALEDGQDIAYLEKKYLGPPTRSVGYPIDIKREDYKLVKNWSEKYSVPANVRYFHELVRAQPRRTVDKNDLKRLVGNIFESVLAIRDDIHEHLKDSDILDDYDVLFVGLLYQIIKLATCDLSSEVDDVVPSEAGDVVPSEAGDVVPSEAGDVVSSEAGDVVPLETGEVEKEYGLEVD